MPKAKAIITDPPYIVNIRSDLNAKSNPWADIMNSSVIYKNFFIKARNALTDDGCLWIMLNWRSIPMYVKAASDIGWTINSMLVWDKKVLGLSGRKQLRPCYEMVALLAMPNFSIPNRSLRDIQCFPWRSTKPSGHPAEKPEALMNFLIEESTNKGDLIIDPFCGSGTVCASSANIERDFIGIEMDEHWANYSRERVNSILSKKTHLSQ